MLLRVADSKWWKQSLFGSNSVMGKTAYANVTAVANNQQKL